MFEEFKKFLALNKGEREMLTVESVAKEASKFLKELFPPDTLLVLLGDFFLFDESTNVEAHKNNKSSSSLKVFNEEGTMQGDLPTINRKAGVSSEGDLEGKKVDEGESLILEKGKYLRSMKSNLPKPNKLRNVKKKAKNNSVIVNKSDSRVDEAVSKPTKSESKPENLVVVKNEKDLNSATAEKPKTYVKENFGDFSPNNLAYDHIRSTSDELENQKVYKQAINTNEPRKINYFRTPDSVNRKYVVTGKPRISKPRDIGGKPQNTSQK
ncbi:hypothetical protein NBO_2g0070, partial [Nosema bombycis CQ1]